MEFWWKVLIGCAECVRHSSGTRGHHTPMERCCHAAWNCKHTDSQAAETGAVGVRTRNVSQRLARCKDEGPNAHLRANCDFCGGCPLCPSHLHVSSLLVWAMHRSGSSGTAVNPGAALGAGEGLDFRKKSWCLVPPHETLGSGGTEESSSGSQSVKITEKGIPVISSSFVKDNNSSLL